MIDHREIAFEAAVEHSWITSGGYENGDAALYDHACRMRKQVYNRIQEEAKSRVAGA